ncbi:MAG: cation transporter [Chloroflexi bacterium]|jgi:cobalt-zinc-cadmium efflux system protein|nr:MAG: cation transporter [Chloroflexota bacterium]TMC45676.1 MAG: cation transporter [Chloroflexota bacterium]TMD34659.1 MAG: cation transporter [Chloroflexota bacterium]TMD42225.1 MAG: cation transporter [Chloroflexota bacterium]
MSDQHIGHNHNHTHGMAKQALRLAFFLTIVILVAELVGGIVSNSLALFSDAGHVVTDIFALGLAWFAAVQAERPANARKTFGYHRVGILAALVNAVTLIIIAIVISLEAFQRFQHPEPVQPFIMFLSAGIGIAVNLFIGLGLQKEGHSLNVRAATMHVFGDVIVSVGVIVAGIIILLTGWTLVDPLLSVGIAVLIAFGAWGILRETTDILLESTPRDISLSDLVGDMKKIEGVKDVHDLHVWCIASGMYALSCHTRINDHRPSCSSPILQSLNSMLSEKYHIDHATIQFECNDHRTACCEMDGLYCRMENAQEKSNGHSHKHETLLSKHNP